MGFNVCLPETHTLLRRLKSAGFPTPRLWTPYTGHFYRTHEDGPRVYCPSIKESCGFIQSCIQRIYPTAEVPHDVKVTEERGAWKAHLTRQTVPAHEGVGATAEIACVNLLLSIISVESRCSAEVIPFPHPPIRTPPPRTHSARRRVTSTTSPWCY